MHNTTALLCRHQDAILEKSTLLVDATDLELGYRINGLGLHTDSFTISVKTPTAEFAATPSMQNAKRVIVPQPKSHERLCFLLQRLAAQIDQPVDCWLVGPTKGGVKGALKRFQQYVSDTVQLDSARHCKLYQGQLQPAKQPLEWQQFATQYGHIFSLPGVFNHGRLDIGTALLLEDWQKTPLSGQRVLDVGCGAGVLSIYGAKNGHQMSAVDISATALAATQKTLTENACDAQVFASDMLSEVTERYDAIISNPPFHTGMTRDLDLAKRLIQQSKNHLKPGGELRLVANRNLPYHDWLAQAFGKVSISRETGRFRVWRAFR